MTHLLSYACIQMEEGRFPLSRSHSLRTAFWNFFPVEAAGLLMNRWSPAALSATVRFKGLGLSSRV